MTDNHGNRIKALNSGLDVLKTIIPDLDESSRVILISKLGNALVHLIGPRGTFSALHNGKDYFFRLEPSKIVYSPDK